MEKPSELMENLICVSGAYMAIISQAPVLEKVQRLSKVYQWRNIIENKRVE